MTLADTIRHQVLTLDAQGIPASHIAHALRIPVERVDRILDDHDAEQGVPHQQRMSAPVLEPLGGPAVIVSQAAVGGGRDNDPTRPKRQPREQPKTREPKPQQPTGQGIECGTVAGYYLHRRADEPTCRACKDAYNETRRKGSERRRSEPIECGTYAGRGKHKRAGEPVCDACRIAYNEWQRGRWAELKGLVKSPIKPIRHGTPAGHQAHKRRGEQSCDDCRTAYSAWKLQRTKARRAAS